MSPSRPDPCLVFFVSVPLFSLFRLASSTPCSLIFVFFSQALGKPKCFWFGFPLVFSSSCTRTTTTTRTSSSSTAPRLRPAPVFEFLFFVRRRSSFWCWLVVACCGRFGPLSPSLSLLVVRLRGEHECSDQAERGGGLSDGTPAFYRHSCFLGLNTKRCPGRSVLNRLRSPHLFPQSPKAVAGRCRWGSRPYCHTDAFLAWRTVLSCKRLLALPRLEGGSAVRFSFVCFSCLVRCSLSLFVVCLFLGSLFEKMLRERTSVLGVVVGLVFFFDSALLRLVAL